MNEVFIIGKIVNEVKYKFIVNSKKNFSNAEFKIEQDNQLFFIKAYNNIADLCYRKLHLGDIVFINGKIETNMIINIMSIFMLKR